MEQNTHIVQTTVKDRGRQVVEFLDGKTQDFAIGFNGNKEKAKKFVLSCINEIRKSALDPKKDLTNCTLESIFSACNDAMKLRLEFDARQHAHLVKRFNKDKGREEVTLQIGYRGYLSRLEQRLNGFEHVVNVVYAGDTLKVSQDGLNATASYTPSNPFGGKDSDIVGVYALLSWVSYDGLRVSTVTTIGIDEIKKIRNSAQTKFIWDTWFTEKAKVACIRRACKMHFASLTCDLDEYDNQDYDMNNFVSKKSDEVNEMLEIGNN